VITTAPLPRWSHLFRALGADPAAAVSPWLKPWDSGLLSPRTTWSLAAIAQAVSKRQGLPARVLLPGWICNQSLWPLRQIGAELIFLPVTPDGRMDWSVAEALGSLDMVVVVHSFGFPAEMSAARDFANSRGALLVEDAAHALMATPGIHDSGDVVLYSPHKLLAAPAGGMVVVRPRAEGWAADIAAELGQPESAANEWRWLGRRVVQGLIPDGLRCRMPQGGQAEFLADPATSAMDPPLAPSRLACSLLAAADLEDEAASRRANEDALRKLVRKLPDLRPLFHDDTAIPYRLALRASSPQAAAARYAALRAARLPVESWPDLPPEVAGDPRHADGALALRRCVLLLPVHGVLTPDQLVRAYAKVLR
jgi:hypothetical protein